MTGFPTSADIYLEMDGKKVASGAELHHPGKQVL